MVYRRQNRGIISLCVLGPCTFGPTPSPAACAFQGPLAEQCLLQKPCVYPGHSVIHMKHLLPPSTSRPTCMSELSQGQMSAWHTLPGAL